MRITAVLMLVSVLSLAGCADWVQVGHTNPGQQPGSASNSPLLGSPPAADAAPGAAPAGPQAAAAGSPEGAAPIPAQPVRAVRGVVLRLSPRARQQIAADPRFTGEALLAAVTAQLRTQGLLAEHDPRVHATLKITLDDFTIAPATNTVLFGYVFSNAVLAGEVSFEGAQAAPRPPFTVHARAHLASRAQSPEAQPFNSLYRRFALLTVADIRGVAQPPEPTPR